MNKEECPELVFKVGICENPKCIEECDQSKYCAPTTCKHRLARFVYGTSGAYIEGCSGTTYAIDLFL